MDERADRRDLLRWRVGTILSILALVIGVLQIDAVPKWISAAGARYFYKDPTHITYSIHYANVGATRQSGVSFRVTLPGDVEYIKGTSYYRGAGESNWKSMGDGVVSNGYDFVNFPSKGGIYVAFTAKLIGSGKRNCNGTGVGVMVTVKSGKAAEIASSVEIDAHCG
ncbi:hypothetical protein [Streptomyces sp. NPDC090080]|uniref:hypothetical protein n=1 Tax=Streptomyces sp. NPDC090080 TaxID=3365939 RepID=UPI003828299D